MNQLRWKGNYTSSRIYHFNLGAEHVSKPRLSTHNTDEYMDYAHM